MIANHSVNQQLSQQLKNLLLTCAYPNPASSAPPPPPTPPGIAADATSRGTTKTAGFTL
jgi:hypothetical protein